MWWILSISPKIRVFMWLVTHNSILTKDNLLIRGWVGPLNCQFCSYDETIDHLFLNCTLAQRVWFWLGKSQDYMQQWHTLDDILTFALSMTTIQRQGFLLVVSAVCWTLWKHRNERCFDHCHVKTARSIIFLIKSLLCYWAGNTSEVVQMEVGAWLPILEDATPLNQFLPLEMVVYRPLESIYSRRYEDTVSLNFGLNYP